MQKYQILLLVFAVSLSATAVAQDFYEAFRTTEIISCPFDPESQVEWPTGWMVYHTQNNQWDGAIDSNWCISVELSVSGFNKWIYLLAEEIDRERPVFLRNTKVTNQPVQLPPNMLFDLSYTFEMVHGESVIVGNGAIPVSGLRVAVDIPAEVMPGRDHRTRLYGFQDTTDWVLASQCFASEKFEEQFVDGITLAYAIRHTQQKGRLLELGSLWLMPVYEFDILDKHIVESQWWQDTAYRIPVDALASKPWAVSNYLLPYTDTTYPSSAHISYYDLEPEVQSDTTQTISLIVEDYMSLIPQYFTSLRGGLVNQNDTIRHRVELVNEGGMICLNIIEITFGPGTRYVHQAGTIDMQSDMACMMFRAGSAFELAENASLYYGNPGQGFLAMHQGSMLILRKGADLTIENTLVIQSNPFLDQTSPTVFMHPGSRLTFGGRSQLWSWAPKHVKLRVMMLGGQVDISHLTEEETERIEFVYPDRAAVQEPGKLTLVRDRANHELRVYAEITQAQSAEYSIIDVAGRQVKTEAIDVHAGHYYFTLDLSQLHSGWYVVTLQTSEGRFTAPFTYVD